MALTARQKLDLHEAIHEYLLSNGEIFPRSLETFREEAGISTSPSSGKGLLEKKWTSVVRLQKKVMELEAQITELQKQNVSVGPPNPALEGVAAFKNARGPLPHAPPAASLVGHRSPVTSIAVHPLYSLVASASEDSTVKIWDYESAQYERSLKGHTGVVNGVAFNSSGTLLASCSADMSIKLWDMKVYSCTATLRGHDHTVSAVEFSLAGDHVFSCSRDGTIKCWEISSTYCIRTFLGHLDWVKCMAISLDGEHLASGSTDHSIIVWRASSGQALQTLRGHEHVVECLCYGKQVEDALRRAATAASLATEPSTSIQSHESRLVSGSRDRTIRLWDPLQGICLQVISIHQNWVRGCVLDPSGRYLVSCSDDKSIRTFDLKEERCVRTIESAHAHFVTCVALSPVRPLLLSGSVDKSLSVWACS